MPWGRDRVYLACLIPLTRGEGGRSAGERARRQSPEADHSSRARYLKQTLAGALPGLSAMVLGRFSLLLSHLTGCSCFPLGETKKTNKKQRCYFGPGRLLFSLPPGRSSVPVPSLVCPPARRSGSAFGAGVGASHPGAETLPLSLSALGVEAQRRDHPAWHRLV